MKVLFINAVCGIGSTGRIVTDLCDVLRKDGHQVMVAYGIRKATHITKEETIRINNKFGYYIHNALAKITDKTGLYSSLATRILIKKIRRYNPDIIHLHNLHGYYINYRILFDFLAEYNKPVVWTLHDCWAFTGHCSHFVSVNCNKWKTQCSNCEGLKIYPKCYFHGNVENNYRIKQKCFTSINSLTIITPSNWLASLVKESFLKVYPVQTIHNGIDLSIFKPTPNDFKQRHKIDDRVLLLSVANVWNQKKGLEDLIKLSNLLDIKRYQIVIVGLSEEQLAQLPNTIIGITRTTDLQELVEIYSAADVFLNLSYEDTFPTVNLEALACGTSVITYDTGGCPEMIDSFSGAVIKQGDLSALKNLIEKLPSYDAKSIQNGVSKFSKETMFQEYMNVYRKLINDIKETL